MLRVEQGRAPTHAGTQALLDGLEVVGVTLAAAVKEGLAIAGVGVEVVAGDTSLAGAHLLGEEAGLVVVRCD